MDYEKYVNWDEVPTGITHVRFEAITVIKDTMNCYGIKIIKRPEAPGNAQQQVQADSAEPHSLT